MNKELLVKAKSIEHKMVDYSKFLYLNAEVGFDLKACKGYIAQRLRDIGIEPFECGRCGIGALIKGSGEGRTVLLRADADALMGIDPRGKNKAMHACGHHFHTAMLLGAAEILNTTRSFSGNVKLMIQGAEEILEGAKDMIENGILEDPRPDAAMMVHVMTAVDIKVGGIVVSSGGVSAPAADFFRITVSGRAAHGALSHQGVDAISAAAYILVALNEIKAREISINDAAHLTVGKISGGEAANALPSRVVLEGSLRAFDDEVRELVKRRLSEISTGVASAFRAEASVEFLSGCPCLKNDAHLSDICYNALLDLFGGDYVWLSSTFGERLSGGSEDFAYVSQSVPSVMIGICAGSKRDGYEFPLHNPAVRFDERALTFGAAAYAAFALAFLGEKE